MFRRLPINECIALLPQIEPAQVNRRRWETLPPAISFSKEEKGESSSGTISSAPGRSPAKLSGMYTDFTCGIGIQEATPNCLNASVHRGFSIAAQSTITN
jgi:hypothetical protein